MTPLEFLSFRAFLDESSGFQSAQFRELETLVGVTDTFDLEFFASDPSEYARLEARIAAPTFGTHSSGICTAMGTRCPIRQSIVIRPLRLKPTKLCNRSSSVLTGPTPRLLSLCEALTDLDEALQEWRYRHVMMVQRTMALEWGPVAVQASTISGARFFASVSLTCGGTKPVLGTSSGSRSC